MAVIHLLLLILVGYFALPERTRLVLRPGKLGQVDGELQTWKFGFLRSRKTLHAIRHALVYETPVERVKRSRRYEQDDQEDHSLLYLWFKQKEQDRRDEQEDQKDSYCKSIILETIDGNAPYGPCKSWSCHGLAEEIRQAIEQVKSTGQTLAVGQSNGRAELAIGALMLFSPLFINVTALVGHKSGLIGAAAGDHSQTIHASRSMSLLASSELKDLEPALQAAAQQAGITLQFTYAGTLDIAEQVNARQQSFDLILPANGAYTTLALNTPPAAREKLFYSRLALGVKPGVMQKLGWDKRTPTWTDIGKACAEGKLRYAMTSPMRSNSGMSALLAVALAAAGRTEDLNARDVNLRELKRFLAGQKLSAASSGWLADAFGRDSSALDAMVNYESVILRLNERLPANERLVLLYPKDGVISADYPLMLLNGSYRDGFNKLVSALRSASFQGEVLQKSYLRPSNPDAVAHPALPTAPVAELAFPNRMDAIDAILMTDAGRTRRPTTTILVVDTSSLVRADQKSVEQQQRNANIQRALLEASGIDPKTRAEKQALMAARERMVLISFWNGRTFAPDSAPDDLTAESLPDTTRFVARAIEYNLQSGAEHNIETSSKDIGSEQPIKNLARAQSSMHAASLRRYGGNGQLYYALDKATRIGLSELAGEPTRTVNILLFTDGNTVTAEGFEGFKRHAAYLSATRIRVFPLIFGNASSPEMLALAEFTGGRVFDMSIASTMQVFEATRSVDSPTCAQSRQPCATKP